MRAFGVPDGGAELCHRRQRTTPFDGRTWDRIQPEADRLEPTLDDFLQLLQGFLVDAEGQPVTLSTTRIHSALGRIRDMAAAGDLARVVETLVRELGRP